MSAALDRIEALVTQARDLADLVARRGQRSVAWQTRLGECEAQVLLYRIGQVAVVDAYLLAGDTFPLHGHRETEHLVLYEGTLEIETLGYPMQVLQAPSGIELPPGIEHTVTALTAARMIGVTIPASPGYSDDGTAGAAS